MCKFKQKHTEKGGKLLDFIQNEQTVDFNEENLMFDEYSVGVRLRGD